MESIFIHLAMILFMAFIVSYIARAFNQPIIIGYIIAGITIAFIIELGFVQIDASKEIIGIFSQFGIAFLLFIVGLHLNPKVIKEIGMSSLLVGLGQIILTFIAGFLVAFKLLGFDIVASAYIGIALAFSSTIIIMKLLSDKHQLDSLFGKISIGILIIQDLVAVAVLMVISSISAGGSFSAFATKSLLGGGSLIILLFFVGVFILPRLTKDIAKSQELLFLFSICWCFVVAAAFSYLGFSMEIGALLAGVSLSISPYSVEISSRVRPLRDFFLIIFFIILGLNIHISEIGSIITNALILSIVVLIVKPFALMGLMALFGYTKRTNFQVGTTLAQLSGFSIIVLTLGVSRGHITEDVLSTIAMTLVITIIFSTYLIMYSDEFYRKFSRQMTFFERGNIRKERKIGKKYDAVLFGYNRIGFGILKSLKKINKKYLVVDFNPDTISDLTKFKVPCLYGDVYDQEILSELPLNKIQLAVSTIPEFETNYLLIESIRMVNPDAVIIVRAHQIKDALDLYKKGASYVLTPHFLGGEYIAKMIKDIKTDQEEYKDERIKHIKSLTEIMKRGHEHPEVEKN